MLESDLFSHVCDALVASDDFQRKMKDYILWVAEVSPGFPPTHFPYKMLNERYIIYPLTEADIEECLRDD